MLSEPGRKCCGHKPRNLPPALPSGLSALVLADVGSSSLRNTRSVNLMHPVVMSLVSSLTFNIVTSLLRVFYSCVIFSTVI